MSFRFGRAESGSILQNGGIFSESPPLMPVRVPEIRHMFSVLLMKQLLAFLSLENRQEVRQLPLAELPESGCGQLSDLPEYPYCGHGDICGNGSSGRKRRGYGRIFSACPGIVRHQIHRDDAAWIRYVEPMFFGLSLRTAFDWRYRILNAFRSMPKLFDVVEADDTCFLTG